MPHSIIFVSKIQRLMVFALLIINFKERASDKILHFDILTFRHIFSHELICPVLKWKFYQGLVHINNFLNLGEVSAVK